jgi:hypothetical protein
MVLERDDPKHLSRCHIDSIEEVEIQLQNITQISDMKNEDLAIQEKIENEAELYRLACLIYLERVVKGTPRYNPRLIDLLRKAFAIFKIIKTCDRPFPVFVIACEAQTEADRALSLNVMQHTEVGQRRGNINMVNDMVKASWLQEDLCTGDQLDTLLRYNGIISAHPILPSFI